MPIVDRIVAVAVLGTTGATVAWRAWKAWREFRIQRKALGLLVRSVSDVGEPRHRTPTP